MATCSMMQIFRVVMRLYVVIMVAPAHAAK
jgi:hypothetical protein